MLLHQKKAMTLPELSAKSRKEMRVIFYQLNIIEHEIFGRLNIFA